MDRHVLAGLLGLLGLLAGCSKSDQAGDATATAAAPDTARMVATPNEAPAAPSEDYGAESVMRSGSAAAPPQSMELNLNAGSAPPATIDVAPAPAPGPPPPAPLANPLRLDFEPRAGTSMRDNPLRTLDAAPSPDASELAGAPPPAGGSSPSTAAAPPDEPRIADAIATPTRAQAALAAQADSENPFDEVEVFYGTDRHSSEAAVVHWPEIALNFLPTGIAALLTLGLGVAAMGRRSFGLAFLSLVGAGASVGLGYQASAVALTAIRQSGSVGPRYLAERAAGGRIDVGVCKVTIPRTHKIGEVESPSITRLEIRPDAARHVVLTTTERLMDSRFYELLKARTLASARRELFVFVHGFNVSFEDAARRTAQIHYDLKFEGAPIFFSWPANTKFVLTYGADAKNVAWSVPHLKQFLLEIVKHSEARSINLIAHSMGNRALTAALREIDLELRDQSRPFNQVILAAPDIDADEFRQSIAPAMQRTARQFTLYASARDDALLASQLVHRGPRAGDAGSGLVVVPGIDTIDVTAIDSSPWGHSYYGSSDPVLNDLRALFTRAIPARERSWLTPAQRGDLTYWIFQPTRTAASSGDINR